MIFTNTQLKKQKQKHFESKIIVLFDKDVVMIYTSMYK